MNEPEALDRLTCVLCPLGCELEVRNDGEGWDVQGNLCDKGIDFAREEVLFPKRNLATSVPVEGHPTKMVSVRLSDRVARDMILPLMKEIKMLRPRIPIKRGQVLMADVLGTGVDVIATRSVD